MSFVTREDLDRTIAELKESFKASMEEHRKALDDVFRARLQKKQAQIDATFSDAAIAAEVARQLKLQGASQAALSGKHFKVRSTSCRNTKVLRKTERGSSRMGPALRERLHLASFCRSR